MKITRCTLKKVGKEWEIKDPNNSDCPLVGPYSDKKEAEEVRDGLNRFYKKCSKEWIKLCEEEDKGAKEEAINTVSN